MRKSTINNNINKSFYAIIVLFLIMVVYLLIIILFQSDKILDNPYNDRTKSSPEILSSHDVLIEDTTDCIYTCTEDDYEQ